MAFEERLYRLEMMNLERYEERMSAAKVMI